MCYARNIPWSDIDSVLHEVIKREMETLAPLHDHLQRRLDVVERLDRKRNGYKRASFALYYDDFLSIESLVKIEKMARLLRTNIPSYVQACIILYEEEE